MTGYHFLGILNIFVLLACVGISVFVLTRRYSKKLVFSLAGLVMVLMLGVSVSSVFIYLAYHR